MQDPLFKDVIINQPFEIRKQCNVCWKWFETTDYYIKQCLSDVGKKGTKLLQRTYGLNDLPFKNYNRIKKCYE